MTPHRAGGGVGWVGGRVVVYLRLRHRKLRNRSFSIVQPDPQRRPRFGSAPRPPYLVLTSRQRPTGGRRWPRSWPSTSGHRRRRRSTRPPSAVTSAILV